MGKKNKKRKEQGRMGNKNTGNTREAKKEQEIIGWGEDKRRKVGPPNHSHTGPCDHVKIASFNTSN